MTAFDLYSRLASESEDDLFFSPSSVSLALAMTYSGADGETAREMADVLRFSLPPDQLHAAFRQLQSDTRLGGVEQLGMRRAFSDVDADFSKMSDDPEGRYIGAVLHKAFVDVNENGTEAAAATAVVMMGRGRPPERRIEFRADHPFLFLIRDRVTGLIHFMGRVSNPRSDV